MLNHTNTYSSLQNRADIYSSNNKMHLLLMVYEKIILNLKQICILIDEKKVILKNVKINQTLDLIEIGLLNCLTNNQTEVEKKLEDFYLSSMGAIIHANIHDKTDDLIKLSQSFTEMKDIWITISQ